MIVLTVLMPKDWGNIESVGWYKNGVEEGCLQCRCFVGFGAMSFANAFLHPHNKEVSSGEYSWRTSADFC